MLISLIYPTYRPFLFYTAGVAEHNYKALIMPALAESLLRECGHYTLHPPCFGFNNPG